jgi:hypothetical protein
VLAQYLRPALPRPPVLYLMAPMGLYRTPALEAAREFPFHTLTGCPVRLLVCEDLYRGNREWFALWPEVRRQAAFGVFLDHCGGWVARGTWAEAAELMMLGRPVWWFNGGELADRFGFGPPRPDYARFHRRVGLGYGSPVLSSRTRPLRALQDGHRTLRGVLRDEPDPRGKPRLLDRHPAHGTAGRRRGC